MKQGVVFFSRDGLKISGNRYRPARNIKGSRLPAILLCQGLSGIKEKILPAVAEAFASAGYITLAFDYCGCGKSDDRRPRTYLFPLERAEDVFSAIAYHKSLSSVDKNRIGLYGLSYGGGIAIYSATLDTTRKVQKSTVRWEPFLYQMPAFLTGWTIS
ncbi:MAG TPA: alpha/beta fold hydrolase [Desulfobacteraceae bacterium]|nr:alpha/beta fold hydrolase [Desulfobacteraceae bacterium]HPJ68686.1 alpha/beta fold hydrolase [Desulfobacteraceae bacterium]HPQ29007.1 alpha/beta fold hydrolase [Desulfobacteraceae bacterium]